MYDRMIAHCRRGVAAAARNLCTSVSLDSGLDQLQLTVKETLTALKVEIAALIENWKPVRVHADRSQAVRRAVDRLLTTCDILRGTH